MSSMTLIYPFSELIDMLLFTVHLQTANNEVFPRDGSTNSMCLGLIDVSSVGSRRVIDTHL